MGPRAGPQEGGPASAAMCLRYTCTENGTDAARRRIKNERQGIKKVLKMGTKWERPTPPRSDALTLLTG
jgi:hypothetical protein